MEVVEEVKDDLGNFTNHNNRYTYQLHDRKTNEKIRKVISSLQKRGCREVDGVAEAEENTNVSSNKKQRSCILPSVSPSASHQVESFFQPLEQACQDTVVVLTEELTAIRSLKANVWNIRKQNETILRDATIAISKSILPSGEESVAETTYHSFDEAIEALRKAKQVQAESVLVETQIYENLKRTQVQLQSTINLHIQYQQRAQSQQLQTCANNQSPLQPEQTLQQLPPEQQQLQSLQLQAHQMSRLQLEIQAQAYTSITVATIADADETVAVGTDVVTGAVGAAAATVAPAVGAAGTATDAIAFSNTTTNATGTAATAMPWQQQQHSQAGPSQQVQMVNPQLQRSKNKYMDLIQSSIQSLTPSSALLLLLRSPLPSRDQESPPVTTHKPVAAAAAPAPLISSRGNSVPISPSVCVSLNNPVTQLSSPPSPSVIRNAVLLLNMGSIRTV